MEHLLSQPVFIIFASITIMSVASTATYYWHKVRRAEIEASLKHEMIERGMSAAEIERVLQAPSRSTCKKAAVHGDD